MGIIECLENLLLIALAFILLWGLWSFFSSKERGRRTSKSIKRTICVYQAALTIAVVYLITNLLGPIGVIDMALQDEKFDRSEVEFILTTMFAIYALVTSIVYRLEDKLEQLKQSENVK